MNSEFDNSAPPIKIEFHLHMAMVAPRPEWAAAGGATPPIVSEPVKKRRWLSKTAGVLGLILIGVLGGGLYHRALEGAERREAMAVTPPTPLPAGALLGEPEKPVGAADATVVPPPQAQGRGARVFGLK